MSKPLRALVPGEAFGRLTVLSDGGRGLYGAEYHCVCECGTVKSLPTTRLLNGTTRSCGCLRREMTGTRSTRHGHSQRPEYAIWAGMLARCFNPRLRAWRHYGGRGIVVCERWRELFENFLADMGPRPSPKHSIDRIDNDGDYGPGNCRWATRNEQARNVSRNRLVAHNGETKTVAEWFELHGNGLPRRTFETRIARGLSVDQASSARGLYRGAAELSDDDVRAIRRRARSGEIYRTIAEAFGVTLYAARRAAVGETWRDLDEPVADARYSGRSR